jgi:hypothetical protein
MTTSRNVSIMLVVAMLLGMPVSVLASAEPGPRDGAPSAQQKGLLQKQKGGTDPLTWTIIGVVTITCVVGGIIWASQSN